MKASKKRKTSLLPALVFCLFVPGNLGAAEAARCGWDPACLCISWFGGGGARVEVRCPGGESAGWTEPGTSSSSPDTPDIVDPSGSFVGDGNITTTILQGQPLEAEMSVRLDDGSRRAKWKLQNDPECNGPFKNSPLTENGSWLLSKIKFRDGTGVRHRIGVIPCSLDGAVAWAESTEEHRLQIFFCPTGFELLSDDELEVTIIHEALHVAGQSEQGTNETAGPGDPPRSSSITRAVAQACGLDWNLPLD